MKKSPKSRKVAHVAGGSSDHIEITIPLVIIQDGDGGYYWHCESTDRSAANHMAQLINCTCLEGVYAAVVEVPVVLCPAFNIADVLGDVECNPVRVQLVERLDHQKESV